MKLWDTSTGKKIATCAGHVHEVFGVVLSPDGAWLASSGADRTIKLWNSSTGKQIASLPGHKNAIYAVAISHDGRQVLSGSQDRTIKTWDVSKMTPTQVVLKP